MRNRRWGKACNSGNEYAMGSSDAEWNFSIEGGKVETYVRAGGEQIYEI